MTAARPLCPRPDFKGDRWTQWWTGGWTDPTFREINDCLWFIEIHILNYWPSLTCVGVLVLCDVPTPCPCSSNSLFFCFSSFPFLPILLLNEIFLIYFCYLLDLSHLLKLQELPQAKIDIVLLSRITILLLKDWFEREKIISHEKKLKWRKIMYSTNFFLPKFFTFSPWMRRYWFYVKNDFRNFHQILTSWDPLSQKKGLLRKCLSVVGRVRHNSR